MPSVADLTCAGCGASNPSGSPEASLNLRVRTILTELR